MKKDEQQVVAEIEGRLIDRFSDVPADQVSATVAEAHRHFITSAVRDYIGLLVERRALSTLQAGLHSRG